MSYQSHEFYLKRCIEISNDARESGNTPFGALLVDSYGNILMEQGNIEVTSHDATKHAEATLASRASAMYEKKFLWNCTLYTTAEPCVMCSGAIYWSNIGRVVFAMTEKQLKTLTGADDKNPTLDVPCRSVFEKGQKNIQVIGPFEELAKDAAAVHIGYWNI